MDEFIEKEQDNCKSLQRLEIKTFCLREKVDNAEGGTLKTVNLVITNRRQDIGIKSE